MLPEVDRYPHIDAGERPLPPTLTHLETLAGRLAPWTCDTPPGAYFDAPTGRTAALIIPARLPPAIERRSLARLRMFPPVRQIRASRRLVDVRCRDGRLRVPLSRGCDSGVGDQDVIAANRRIVRCEQSAAADTPRSTRAAALPQRTTKNSYGPAPKRASRLWFEPANREPNLSRGLTACSARRRPLATVSDQRTMP